MQKKKSQAKITLPLVSVNKPTETSKSYAPKTNTNKFRDIQEKNVFFDMPSIHQNDLSIKNVGEFQQKLYKKLQLKILKRLEQNKENKLLEQWELYIKKSDILNSRSGQFNQIQQFLLKIIYKYFIKFYQQQSFTFNHSFNNFNNDNEDCRNMTLMDNSNSKTIQSFDKNMINSSIKSKASFQHVLRASISLQNGDQTSIVNILNHKNVILQKKLSLYEQRIIQLQANIQKIQAQSDIQLSEKNKANDLMQTLMLKNKFKYQSEIKGLQIEALTKQVSFCKNFLEEYRQQLQKKSNKNLQLQKENKQYKQYIKYKELWLMASEEAQTWKQLEKQEKQQKQKGINKIKMLKDKNRQLLNYFNMNNVANPDQEEDKQDLDKIIKQFKQWLMIISVPKINYNNHPLLFEEQSQQKSKMSNQVDLKLLRPNFYIFFEAFENTFKIEKNIINIRPIQHNFYLKIRLVFDAFYRQFIIASSYKQYPSFPQFFIGFLQKYQINNENHRVQYRKTPIENEQKITFIVNLFNKNFCNTWQCQIFKDFLLENYYLDEIFFYLECRNQFNNGIPSNQALGSTDPITFVKLSKALKIVSKKLIPYENFIIQKVKNILKNKKKIKFGEAYIDKNFVLKLLLEIYALQRPKSQRIFQSSFKAKVNKSYITYGDFHNFMNINFSFLSSPQIAQLYREIYLISSGHVTHKAIHYICGIKGLFIPLLIQKRIGKNNQEKSISKDMLLLDIQNTFVKIKYHLPDIGYQPFMKVQSSLNEFMRQMDYYKLNKSAFYQKIYEQKCNILKINCMVQMAASYQINPSDSLEQSEIQSNIIQLHSFLHQIDSQVHLISRQKQRRVNCLKMLVHNFRVRIQQSISQFQKINDEEIKKLKNQIERGTLVQRRII